MSLNQTFKISGSGLQNIVNTVRFQLETDGIDNVLEAASRNFEGLVQGHVTYFYGLCPHCMHKAKKTS